MTTAPLRLEDLAPHEEDREALVDRDGRSHYFIAADTLRHEAQIRKFGVRLDELRRIEEPTDEQDAEYRQLLIDFVAFVVPSLDREAIGTLGNNALTRVLLAFGELQVLERGMLQPAIRSMSETSSLGSNGSTAETPSDG